MPCSRRSRAKRVIVLEKSLAVGIGGIVSTNVRTTCDADLHRHRGPGRPADHPCFAAKVFGAASLDHTTFLDLDRPWSRRC